MSNSRSQSRRGFTLIELLVVVGIIALLASILMPSLAKARKHARTVICAAHLQQLGRAQATYATTSDTWLPGSPWSTGYSIALGASSIGGANSYSKNDFANAFEWLDFVTPLRREMFGAAARFKPSNYASTAEMRADMVSTLTEGPFHCPENKELAPPWPAGQSNSYPIIRATSYLSMWTMMRAGSEMYNKAASVFPGVNPGYIAQSANWEMAVQRDWLPKLSKVKRPSLKVYIADGLRYVGQDMSIDYNVEPASAKGMMSGSPPSSYHPTDGGICREYTLARRYSYRHGKDNKINALFLDGHVDSLLSDIASDPIGELPRQRGPAVHPKHYYPAGTIVGDPSTLHEDIPAGTVLP